MKSFILVMAQSIRYVKIGFILGLKLVLKLGWHFKKITLKITTRIQHLTTIRRFNTHIMNTQFFLKIKYYLKGNGRSHKASFLFIKSLLVLRGFKIY